VGPAGDLHPGVPADAQNRRGPYQRPAPQTIVRPTVKVLAGLVGPDARKAWDRLAEGGEVERLNAVLRFLFAAVIIDEHRGPRGIFDYSRIDIEPNPL